MTNEHYVILKEYCCVYFTGYYKVDYLCSTDDMVLTFCGQFTLNVLSFVLLRLFGIKQSNTSKT